jgi:MFS family permease
VRAPAVAGIANGMSGLALRVLVRSRTPEAERCAAFGTTTAVLNASNFAGALLGGTLVAPISPAGCLIAGGVMPVNVSITVVLRLMILPAFGSWQTRTREVPADSVIGKERAGGGIVLMLATQRDEDPREGFVRMTPVD